MNEETKLMRTIMVAISQAGHTVWRNETGQFWTGKPIHKDGDTITLANPRMIPVGLCVGSSDLIGITRLGIFFAVEVKTKTGRISKQQQQFIDHINSTGGKAGVCRSVADALNLLS